jgi:diaminohydroxyphosphoribosylaminopyrimidine deaminase/5-amino-6-(5-phosphoribosylamino)uracil reductase
VSSKSVPEKRAKPSEDERFMRMALKEAEKGAGHVSPNPLVGAVAVKNGKVLAKAFHRKFGDLHAETALLKKLTEDQARGATIYVNLEPCCHIGKTAPCTTALMNAGVQRVVIAHQDPNPLVNGKGMTILSEAGIDVRVGVCEAEAKRMNAPFLTFMNKGRPWILLKIAQSLDGRIALSNGESRWITGEASRTEVHRLRTKLDALLVGVLTVLDDDPLMNVRHVKGRDPIRIIADSKLRIPETARVLSHKDQSKTWILTTEGVDAEKIARLKKLGAVVIPCRAAPDGRVDMNHAMREIARRDITSVLVEGGGTVHASLLTGGLWDEMIIAIAPMLIGADGRPSVGDLGLEELKHAPRLTSYRQEKFDDDHWYYLERNVHGHS